MQGGLERATGEKMVLNFGPQHPADTRHPPYCVRT